MHLSSQEVEQPAPSNVFLNIFQNVMIILQNKKSSLIPTKQLVHLFVQKSMNEKSAPSNVFLNGVRVQCSDQVKYLGVLLNT